jgi:hypothetical protein
MDRLAHNDLACRVERGAETIGLLSTVYGLTLTERNFSQSGI